MLRSIALACVLLSPLAIGPHTRADEPAKRTVQAYSPDEVPLLELLEKGRLARLAKAKQGDARRKFGGSDARLEKAARAHRKDLESFKVLAAPPITWEHKPMNIGTLVESGGSASVVQVIDDKNAVIRIDSSYTAFKQFGPTGSGQVYPSSETVGSNVWITGMRTTGMIDGHVIDLSGIFQSVGTRSFASSRGSRVTVLAVEPWQVDDVPGLLKKQKAYSHVRPKSPEALRKFLAR